MKKALTIVLIVSALIELSLGLGVLFAPSSLMELFHLTTVNNEVMYLATVIGWQCLCAFASATLAALWVSKGMSSGRTLAIVLGIYWIGIGLHLGIKFDRPDHFVLDAAKGLIILTLALRWKPTT